MLEAELRALHRDLRTIAKAYIARLENDLLSAWLRSGHTDRSNKCLGKCCTRSVI